MDVQHVRPVGQHRVDVDLFDVGFVGHRVLGHVQLANMLQWEQCWNSFVVIVKIDISLFNIYLP